MKIEKWIYEGKEIEVPIMEEEEIEKNEDFNSNLENTLQLSEELKNIGDKNE